jgi:catechol 2,3-dioxygenase-like lactoylglutathione lyase family enzyme
MFVDQYMTKLFHVCITVPDIEGALKFCRDIVGLKSMGSLRNEKADGNVLGLTPGEEIEISAGHLCGKITDNATVIDLIEYIRPKTIIGGGATSK